MKNSPRLMAAAVAAGTTMLLFLAGMFPAGMIVLMMIAMHIGVKLERICKIGADRAVRAAGYSPKQPDASLPQGGLCPSPNAAADENIQDCDLHQSHSHRVRHLHDDGVVLELNDEHEFLETVTQLLGTLPPLPLNRRQMAAGTLHSWIRPGSAIPTNTVRIDLAARQYCRRTVNTGAERSNRQLAQCFTEDLPR